MIVIFVTLGIPSLSGRNLGLMKAGAHKGLMVAAPFQFEGSMEPDIC